MRRIKTVLGVVAVIAAMLVVFAAPAMAQDRNDDFCDFFDCNNNNNNVVPAITQDLDQEAESGDVDQSFDVSGTGDNSNQTAGIQGVSNTGNTQNQIGVIDAGGFDNGDDFFDDNNRFFDDDNNRFFDDDNNRFFDDDNNRFFGDDDDGDFEFNNVGSSIDVSPTNTTLTNQDVDQAATAAG
jgi:hypothetical protein